MESVTATLFHRLQGAGPVKISGDVSNLKPGLHGFHIHEFGDTGSIHLQSSLSNFDLGRISSKLAIFSSQFYQAGLLLGEEVLLPTF